MAIVVKIEDMLRYNHLQWYGNVTYWHTNSQTVMGIHGTRGWWKREESLSCELCAKKDWNRSCVQIKANKHWRDNSIKTDAVIVDLMLKMNNGTVTFFIPQTWFLSLISSEHYALLLLEAGSIGLNLLKFLLKVSIGWQWRPKQ